MIFRANAASFSPIDNIVLVGFMGAGKSSAGRMLARLGARRFVDLDERIRSATGLSIPAIFRDRGEEHFRDLESEALKKLQPRSSLVVSTGGGVVLRETNRETLKSLGFVVWLHARPEIIFQRVSRNRDRPLLHTPDPRATIDRLLAERQPLYQSVANTAVDTSDLSREQVAHRILAAFSQWAESP